MTDLVIAIDARLVGGTSTGDSAYWTGLLHGLARIAPNAKFLLFSNAERADVIPSSDRFEWITLAGSPSRWWSLVRFPLAARRRRAVIHTQYNLSPLAGTRSVTTIHDVSFFIGPQWFKPRDLLLLERFVPASAARSGHVITVSNTSKQEIERFIPAAAGKISVTSLACPVHIDPSSVAPLPAGVESPFLLTVGTRWPRKNMELAIQASEMTAFPLIVTGKAGWGEQGAGSKARSVGFVDDATLSSLYRKASLYLAPSRHEGFGLPLLEAFACDCPVICSHGGALPETAGDAACVMSSWEPEAWARAIRAIVTDSSKLTDLKRRGRERVAQFSWEETARLTMEVYEQVAMEHPA